MRDERPHTKDIAVAWANGQELWHNVVDFPEQVLVRRASKDRSILPVEPCRCGQRQTE